MKPTRSWYVAAAILLASLVCGAKAASQPVSEHRCGDSVCEKSETAQSCLADCAAQAAMPLADQPYWPSFAYDRRNTGRSPHTGPLSARIAWTYPAPKARTINQQQTVDADGTIYFATWGSVEGDELGHGMLYALNPDGSLKWTYDPGLPKDQVGTIETTVTIGPDGTLHFGRGDGVLYAVDPDGTKIWTFETFSNTLRGQIVSSPAIAGDGTIYFGTVCYPLLGMCVAGTNAFYALSPDGSLKWTYPEDAMEGGSLSHWVLCNPAIGDDGTVYFTSFRTLYAFYPNGQERWHYDAGDRLWTPTIGDDGTIYVQAFTYLALGLTAGTENLSPGGGRNPFGELCNNQLGVGNDMWEQTGNLMFPWRPDYINGNICADNPAGQMVFVDHVSIEWKLLPGEGVPQALGDEHFERLRLMFDAALQYMETRRPDRVAAWGFVTHITEYGSGGKAQHPPDSASLAALDRFLAYVTEKAAAGRVIFATAAQIAEAAYPGVVP